MFSKLVFLLFITASSVVAQWQCGGTTYTPGSAKFTAECMQTVQDCISQFAANISQVYCQDAAGNLYMEQQPSNGNNNQYATAFEDILDSCLLAGSTTGTWDDGSDGQWYWMAAEPGCYSSSSSAAGTKWNLSKFDNLITFGDRFVVVYFTSRTIYSTNICP